MGAVAQSIDHQLFNLKLMGSSSIGYTKKPPISERLLKYQLAD